MSSIRLIADPTILVIAEQELQSEGLTELAQWLREFNSDVLPRDTDIDAPDALPAIDLLLPQTPAANGHTHNEALVELCGRGCYKSFGMKAGRKTNMEYIANLLGSPGKIPHSSVMYHAKMTFFFAGISRRMSHELIRHYVGADRSEEGCPSQESTRYTEHPGHFTVHPRVAQDVEAQAVFRAAMISAYESYIAYLQDETEAYEEARGEAPKGMDRKRIYEAAAQLLPGAAATSMFWTTNPVALQKLFTERCDSAADLEFQRFATKLRGICFERWPALFRETNTAVSKQQ